MLEKTMKKFDEMMKVMQKEISAVVDSMSSSRGKNTTVKIKKDSTVLINGATCVLLQDTLVKTNQPNVLMKVKD